MKRIFSLLTLILMVMGWGMGQSVEWRGKDKNKNLLIVSGREVPDGSVEIDKIQYAPLTKLENEVKQLRKEKENLQSKIKKMQDENAKVNELSAKNASLQSQNEQLTSENAKLRSQVRQGANNTNESNSNVERLQKELEKVSTQLDEKEKALAEAQSTIKKLEEQLSGSGGLSDSDKDKTIDELKFQINDLEERLRKMGIGWNTDFISFQMDFGFSFMKNSLTKQDFWRRGSAGTQVFEISYAHYLSDDLPIALRAGLGLGFYYGNGAFASMKDTIKNLKDYDGDTYHAYYDFRDVSEEVTLSYLEIPLLLHIGNSYTNQGAQVWGEVGFKIGLNVGTSFEGDGKYSKHIFIQDVNGVPVNTSIENDVIENNNYYTFNNHDLYPDAENMEHETNTLVLWGQLAGGIMVPLTDQIHFNAGVRMGYTFSTIAKEAENPDNCKYILGKSNLLAGSGNRIFTIGMDLGVVYAF